MSEGVTKVGVGVLVFRDGKILLGKRKGNHAPGVYGGPGGHLEFLESIEDCARREVMEETGMEIGNIRFLCLSNLKVDGTKHYIDVGLVADWKSGEPELREPEKCEGWAWYGIGDVPSPLFQPDIYYLEALKGDRNFFDQVRN